MKTGKVLDPMRKERALSLSFAEPAQKTDEYQLILPIGEYFTAAYGKLTITAEFCAAMVANWSGKVLGEREPFLDTDHDRGEANGWIKDLQVRADGLYAKIEFTEKGAALIEGGLYKYFSADIGSVIDVTTGDEVYPVLIACALTNTPAMNTMPAAHLSDTDGAAHGDDPTGGASKGAEEMKTFAEIMAALAAITLTDAEMEALGKLLVKAGWKAPTAQPDAALSAKMESMAGDIAMLRDVNKALSEKLTAITADAQVKRKAEVIDLALKEGRILPKDKETWEKRFDKNPDLTADVLAEMPKAVDLSERGTGAGGEQVDVAFQSAAAKAGLTKESIDKYAPK
jgi:phage I-like protein